MLYLYKTCIDDGASLPSWQSTMYQSNTAGPTQNPHCSEVPPYFFIRSPARLLVCAMVSLFVILANQIIILRDSYGSTVE